MDHGEKRTHMQAKSENEIDRLLRHCEMFNFGSNPGPFAIGNEAAMNFIHFGLLHLICTMFITHDDKNDHGGLFYRILSKTGKSNLLDKIEEVLGSKIGNSTLREFIQNKRNKLAVHGDLSFNNQKEVVKEITFREDYVDQFYETMAKLEYEINMLYNSLLKLRK